MNAPIGDHDGDGADGDPAMLRVARIYHANSINKKLVSVVAQGKDAAIPL